VQKTPRFNRILILILLTTTLLAGCSLGKADQPVPTPLPTGTPMPTATLTPTPEIPLTILLLPADMDQELSNLYQTVVYGLAQTAGYRFQVRNTLSVADLALEPALKVVIVLPPDPGLTELAAAAPQAQFLAVNIPGLTAAGNLSVLADTTRPDITAFLAGYIAAMITEDYHAGIMLPKDDPASPVMVTAYNNGVEYFCGLCNPWAGPFYDYPLVVEIPADAPQSEYGAYADYLINYMVETMYVHPSLATPELLTYLSSSGVLVIGNSTPQKKMGNWVATIQPDVVHAIQTAWPDLVAGNGGLNVPSPLVLADVNPEFLTPGKQKMAEQVLSDLQAGYIDTGVNQ